jgi:peptidoglycan hydrolase-like protein with peptidoglycan-binding domain
LVASGVHLLLIAGAAGYAVFHTHFPDTVVSQTAAAAIAPAVLSIAPVAAEVSARAAQEASHREAAAQRQAEEQRLADMKAAEEEARRSAEPGEADLRLTYRDRQRLQVALSSLGFDVGAIDGAFGPRTRQMIRARQIKSGNISTGFFTAPQKNALLIEGAPAIAKWEDQQRRANAEEQRRAAEEQRRAAEEEQQQRLQQQQAAPSERQSGFKWPWQ